jgi:hypothetical protein
VLQEPRLGQWGKAGNLVGLVARVDGDEVTLFDPGARQQTTVSAASVTPLPAGAVRVSVSAVLPVPHGVGEDELRRWVASLADDSVRERALAALADAGLDDGAAQPPVSVEVAVADAAACLCGATPAIEPGAAGACPGCGRQSVGPARGAA